MHTLRNAIKTTALLAVLGGLLVVVGGLFGRGGALIGLGLGLVASPTLIAAQSSVGWTERAVVTGTNLFTGAAGVDGVVHLDGGGVLAIADRLGPGPVFATVHPRAVALHRHRPEGSARNAWPGRISSIEPVGDRIRIGIDANPSIVAEITTTATRDLGLAEATEVWVAVKATEIGAGSGAGVSQPHSAGSEMVGRATLGWLV